MSGFLCDDLASAKAAIRYYTLLIENAEKPNDWNSKTKTILQLPDVVKNELGIICSLGLRPGDGECDCLRRCDRHLIHTIHQPTGLQSSSGFPNRPRCWQSHWLHFFRSFSTGTESYFLCQIVLCTRGGCTLRPTYASI
jgi:hypothetical protein